MTLTINGESRTFIELATLADLVENLGLKGDRVAVELNRNIVSRSEWASTSLKDGDRLEIVHFVGGGTPQRSVAPL
ncbi:MAG: sulfur carrier protein ThiS [Terriglobia bacterium]|jgi:thiamine biosynthesis protein ThiS|nr:sulfur carrier protein ThiS [Terriglobia bacterium]